MEVRQFVFFCLILSLLAGRSPVSAASGQLTVLSSTDSEFTFVCSFPPDYSSLTRFTVQDSSVQFGYLVQVAIPYGSQVRLVSSEGRAPQAVTDSQSQVSVSPAASLVEISAPTTIRGRQIVSVRINPVTPFGIYAEVEVHLAFELGRAITATAAASDPGFERVFKKAIANWDAARNWPVAERKLSTTQAASAIGTGLGASDQWYKITVNQTSLYQITGAQLEAAGISLTGLSSDSIRLFNGGGLQLPVDNGSELPTLREVAILVLDGGDDQFGASDRFVFYGEAVDRWRFRSGYSTEWVNNRYTSENVYWLAVTGTFPDPPQRMQETDGSLSGVVDTTISTVRQKAHAEQDRIISREVGGHIRDYYNWFWTDSTRLRLYVSTPGAMAGDSATVFVDARTGGADGFMTATVNGEPASPRSRDAFGCRFATYDLTGLSGALNELVLMLDSVNAAGGIPPYLNYVEVDYLGTLLPSNNRLLFDAGVFDGRAEFQVVDGFSASPTVFSITDPLRPVIVSGYERAGGLVRFRYDLSSGQPNTFLAAPVSTAQAPLAIRSAAPADLLVATPQTDLIIVTPRQFVSALDEYVSYRRSPGHTISVVAVEDIMDNFGFGLYDPTAIRNFLKYAYTSWPSPAPSAVLFVGDANYDFRGHLDFSVPNYVPTYIRATDFTCGDDNYVYFGNFGLLDGDTSFVHSGDRGYDMMTARWPVSSVDQIDVIVAKIKSYESASTLGSWRTRVVLVADDEFSGNITGETYHTTQTETLEKQRVPRRFTRDKIYLWEYPFVNRRKPAVNERIIGAFNEGALVVNYVGHGNPDVWSHESVFDRASDIPRLNNFQRLPLVYVASCAIGFFDDPSREGMAEDLLSLAGGGAIGVVSATRLVYSGPNASFNQDVYAQLFGADSLTINEALFAAKLARQYPGPRPVENDRAYVYMGDPYLRLGIPALRVEFTESPDSLIALGRCHVAGRLVDADGQPVLRDGTIEVTACDSDRRRIHYTDGTPIEYYVGGAGIFRGSATVADGEFAFDFVVPLDISYGGAAARISTYAVLEDVDGLGVVDSLRISQGVAEVADSAGPAIVIGIVGRSGFADGGTATTRDRLQIMLTDSSGLNLTGSVGHGITLTIDDNADLALNLTDLFAYDKDSYTTGSLTWGLEALSPGDHRIKIKAWDNANNVSIVSFNLTVVDGGITAIRDLLNFPNPMGEVTTFYFELTAPAEQFNLDIFTLSGRRVWSFSRPGMSADSYPNSDIQITWDGRDADGDRVATGVYVYKVTAVPSTGETVEQFGKIVVLN
jgi:hypothetical protein